MASSTSTISQPSRRASARATVVLPAAMNPTRYTLSAFTSFAPCSGPPELTRGRPQAAERLEEPRVGNGDDVRAVDHRGLLGAERGDGEGHRHAVIAAGIGAAARRPGRSVRGSGDDEAVGALVGVDAERAEAANQRGDPIALLDPQLPPAPPRPHPPRRR